MLVYDRSPDIHLDHRLTLIINQSCPLNHEHDATRDRVNSTFTRQPIDISDNQLPSSSITTPTRLSNNVFQTKVQHPHHRGSYSKSRLRKGTARKARQSSLKATQQLFNDHTQQSAFATTRKEKAQKHQPPSTQRDGRRSQSQSRSKRQAKV